MLWIFLCALVAVLLVFFVTKCLGSISTKTARDYVKQGAKIIDVRSPGEYEEHHLPGVVNIPIRALKKQIAQYAPDKAQVLLLHCLSGGRSGLATRVLKRMGYQHVFNLGSFHRAEAIASAPSS